MIEIITALILIFGIFNLVRLAFFMVAADIYDIRSIKQVKNYKDKSWMPKITVLIPAHNEELTIGKTLNSVLAANYKNKEIIVIDDGSTDRTAETIKKFTRTTHWTKLRLIQQTNAGKGAALNSGIKKANGELVMVLDADSTIEPDAITNCVKYFKDPSVKAVASSVSLEDNGTWLGLIQTIEYILSYRMKRSLTAFNIEYIIGGVGSVYRKSVLKQVSGYRHNTITEDIDLSMKVVNRGNKANKVIFASDVRSKTEPVHSLSELISQRYRWKLGRLQAFARYRHLFFSRNKKYNKQLTWFQLPHAILGEINLLLEPLFIGTIIYVAAAYGDINSLLVAGAIISTYMVLNILSSTDISTSKKISLIYLVPVVYLMLPILAFVELTALVKSIKNRKKISPNYKAKGNWQHVKRVSTATN